MRIFLLATSALALTSTLALADGSEVAPVADPIIITQPSAYNWSGAYVGIGLSINSGDIDFFNPYRDRSLNDGSGANLVAGYQIQSGNLVYGGELAFYDLNEASYPPFLGNVSLNNVTDVSARLGYAMDRVLVFGQFGFTAGEYVESFSGTWALRGTNFGLGLDYAMYDNFTVGLLYTGRDMEAISPNGSGQSTQIDLNTMALRVAYRF